MNRHIVAVAVVALWAATTGDSAAAAAEPAGICAEPVRPRVAEAAEKTHEAEISVVRTGSGGEIRVVFKALGAYIFKPQADPPLPMEVKFTPAAGVSVGKPVLGWSDLRAEGKHLVRGNVTFTGAAGSVVTVAWRFAVCDDQSCKLVRDKREVKLP